MLDLERKGYLETKGNRGDRSKELMFLGLLECKEDQVWRVGGSSGGLIYMSYLVIYLVSQEMSSKSWKWMSK